MTRETTTFLFDWAKDKTRKQQQALAIGLESSMEKGEELTLEVVKEWVKIVEKNY